jgi:hypothetical protein
MDIFEINILWAFVFVCLFSFQYLDGVKREKKYQKLVEKLIDKLSNQHEDKGETK